MAQTPNLNLPLVDEEATANPPRDINALAEAVDTVLAAVQQYNLTSNDGSLKPCYNTDLNTVTEPGFYIVNYPINGPSSDGFMMVTKGVDAENNEGIFQVFFARYNRVIYIRTKSNSSGSFGTWVAQETTTGAQGKADKALTDAKKYTDDNFRKPAETAPNLLKNSTGRLGLQNWTNISTSLGTWESSAVDNTLGGIFYTTATQLGNHMLDSDPVGVDAGGTYSIQAMFNTGGVTNGLVRVQVINTAKNAVFATIEANMQSSWHRKIATFTIPAGNGAAIVRLLVNGANGVGKHFSQIKLAKTTLDTPYTNEADMVAIQQHVDNRAWQKSKMTSDAGNAILLETGTNLNADLSTGFYMGSNLVNSPSSTTGVGWWYIEVIRHNDLFTIQNAYPLDNQENGYRQRKKVGNVWKPWSDDVFQSGVNAKQGIVDAINAKGGSASTNDTWEVLAVKINAISTTMKFRAVTGINQSIGANQVNYYTVSGLGFTPKVIEVRASYNHYHNGNTINVYGCMVADNTTGTRQYRNFGAHTSQSNWSEATFGTDSVTVGISAYSTDVTGLYGNTIQAVYVYGD